MEKNKKIIVAMGNSCIPHELVFEILKHVPAKSLMRFRCVSKSFGSLISEPLFVQAHQKSCVTQFFVHKGLKDKDVIYSLGHDHLDCVTSCPIKYLDEPCFRNLDYFESINGLVCMWNDAQDVAICNPFTKEHVFIPNPSMNKIIGPSVICCSLGFDPTTKEHKVWKTDLMDTLELSNWIFTIRVDKSWRKLINFPIFYPSRNDSICIDGVIYCVNIFGGPDIAAFSVGDEKFIRSILFPKGVGKLSTKLEYSSRLLEIKGQVALVDFLNFRDKDSICLHVLLNETTWVKQTIKLQSELLLYTSSRPLFTVGSKGEILSVSTCGISPLFLYDIGRKEWRIVDIHKTHEREYVDESRHTSDTLNLVESIWSLR